MVLEQKVAVITGATSGIGRATAIKLRDLGFFCVLIARNTTRLLELAEGFEDDSLVIPCDVRNLEELIKLSVEKILPLGRVDALINAAGIISKDAITCFNWHEYQAMSRLNIEAPMVLTSALLPSLEVAKGAIVNVSSVAGKRSFPGILSYCVTKAALDQYTRCAALELADRKVRINAVNPGVVVTELHRRGGMDDAAYAKFLQHSQSTHPLGRVGSPDEIADLIVFLISEKASWITGETICVDGGRHATCFR